MQRRPGTVETQNPTSALQVLFVYCLFNYSGFLRALLHQCWWVVLGGVFGTGQPRFKALQIH